MELVDGRKWYEESDPGFWNLTQELEGFARKMSSLIAQGNKSPQAFDFARALLEGIELWKAGCIGDLTGYAVRNEPKHVWNAFRGAIDCMNSGKDVDALLSIMQLTGFGKYPNEDFGGQRPAKRASAVLRIFNPAEWGVVDWRTAGMLDILKDIPLAAGGNWNVDQALELAAKHDRREVKNAYLMINEEATARIYNPKYREGRSASLPQTADVEMAVFGLSFKVWQPANPQAQYSSGQTYGRGLRSQLQKLDKQLAG